MRLFMLPLGLSLAVCVAGPGSAQPKRQAPAPTIASTGVLGAADLVAIAKIGRKNQQDEFSEASTLPYVGREFSITLDPIHITTRYDRVARALSISTSAYSSTVYLERDHAKALAKGQNAFGAKASFAKVTGAEFGILLPGSIYSRKPYVHSIEADGETARAMSEAVRIRLTGKIAKATGPEAQSESVVNIKRALLDPTVSSPLKMDTTSYLVSVAITKAEWIDSRTGAILATQNVSS